MRVLIVDDEQRVCQLISNLVDWEGLGFEVAGVMNDGISAYKFIQENMIDLMITDIRMPGCDGLELIQKSKMLYPDMYIVIISGYSQFDYAQNAIRFGVEDYLLKPIRKKDLMATLKKISEKYKEEKQDLKKWQDIQKRLEENKKKVKRSLLEDILKKPEKFGGFFSLERINTEYYYSFIEECYQTIIIKIMLDKRKEDIYTRRILLQKSMEFLNEVFAEKCNEAVFNIIEGQIYGLFNGTTEQLEELGRKLKKVKLDMIRLQDMFGTVVVYIALGKPFNSIQGIVNGFCEARNAMKNRFYYPENFLLQVEENEKDDVKNYIDNAFKKRFLNYVEIMDIENIDKEIENIRERLKQSRFKDGNIVLEVYREVLTLFYFAVNSYNISIPNQYGELQLHLENCGTLDEVINYLKMYILQSLINWMEEKKYVETRPIRVAKQYISDNYYKALTLEMVSKEIGFNATYFSSVLACIYLALLPLTRKWQ